MTKKKVSVPIKNDEELKKAADKTTASDQKQNHPGNKKIRIKDDTFREGNNIDNTLSKVEINSDTEEDETFSALMAENSDLSSNNDEEIEEDILFINDDEDNYEDELLEFSPQEQKEILENITKSKI
ncbi:MAG: hypothetical protein IPL53_24790 [Ignavibacteria bacterium]|nr:hypothetical protein [Ignavibacteria bacterium]